MAIVTFSTLTFTEKEDSLEVRFLQNFSTNIPKTELSAISDWTLQDAHTIEFSNIDQEKAEIRFSFLLDKYLSDLKTKITGNSATYIHQHSGIPLIGNVAFGIIYRDSSIIEIKPVTSCNLDCIYCSISEGLSSKKHDFVLEKDYLVEELRPLITFAGGSVEVHIGVQGEPFLYAQLEELFSDLEQMEKVHTISIDTNGTLLNKERIDRLSQYQKLQLNLSLDALDDDSAKRIAGTSRYNVQHVLFNIAYASEKMSRQPIVAPVFTPGWNEQEMEKIVVWVKSLKRQPILGIQNYLRYKTGRNPGKEWTWKQFYGMITDLEKKYDIKLKLGKEDFGVRNTRPLPKPFQIGEVISAVLKCPDRFPRSSIAAAGNRNISVVNCSFKKDKQVRIKITKDKHNIFCGKLV